MKRIFWLGKNEYKTVNFGASLKVFSNRRTLFNEIANTVFYTGLL